MPIMYTTKNTLFYKGYNQAKIYLGSFLLTSVTVTYIYGGNVVYTVSVPYGTLISDYIPDAISGRTFVGWSSTTTGTTAEDIYANGDITVYGIGKVSKKATSANLTTNNSSTGFSGSWPDNSIIYGVVQGHHHDESGSGHLVLYCDDVTLARVEVHAGQTEGASGSLNLGTRKYVTLRVNSNDDNTIHIAQASVSWIEYVTG